MTFSAALSGIEGRDLSVKKELLYLLFFSFCHTCAYDFCHSCLCMRFLSPLFSFSLVARLRMS